MDVPPTFRSNSLTENLQFTLFIYFGVCGGAHYYLVFLTKTVAPSYLQAQVVNRKLVHVYAWGKKKISTPEVSVPLNSRILNAAELSAALSLSNQPNFPAMKCCQSFMHFESFILLIRNKIYMLNATVQPTVAPRKGGF